MVFSTVARERRPPWTSKPPCRVDIGEPHPPPRARITTIPRDASRAHRRTVRTLFGAFEMERCGVHAVAKARGRGSVVEHVAEVATTAGAQDFVTCHADARVPADAHVRGRDRLVEAGPPSA